MTHTRRSFPASRTKFLSTGVSARQIRVVASDGTRDRVGDILEPSGVVLDAYRRNPIVLAQHDAAQPIARCSRIGVEGGEVVATIDFPAEGVSARSDEYLALVKGGILGAVSVGFLPLRWEPLRDGGMRFTEWECLELSIVSVPANPSALIMERGFRRGVDQVVIGNCGRPLDSECGMKVVSECSIHGQPGAGVDDGAGEKGAQLLRIAALRRRMEARGMPIEPSRVWPADRKGKLVALAELREAHGLKKSAGSRLAAHAAATMVQW